MKRIGTRIGSALAFVVTLGVALGGLTASATRAEAARRDFSGLHWEATDTLLGSTYRRVDLDVDRIEKAHEGLHTPKLRLASGAPVWGMPYYFLGVDPATGTYRPDSILVCIDVLHVDYQVPDGSEYFDLATVVPPETAVRISRVLNAGLQAAQERGLSIATDGSRPLAFTTAEASEIMLAAQVEAWYLFAKDNLLEPLPYLERGDFSVGGVDLPALHAELDALLARFEATPDFASDPITFADRVTLTDADALRGFTLEVDPATSTPGYGDYLGATTSADGSIRVAKKKPLDKPVTLGFHKTFTHSLGAGSPLGSGVRAANDQIKTVLSNLFAAPFEVPFAEDPAPVGPPPQDPLTLPAVSIAKDDGRTVVTAGERLDYVLVAANVGDLPAPDVIVVDQLPEHLDFVESSVAPSAASSGSTLVWDLGELAVGEQREVVVSANIRADVAQGTSIVNTASITSEGVCEDDPVSGAVCTDDDTDIVVPPLDPGTVDEEIVTPASSNAAPAGALATTGDALTNAWTLAALAVVLLVTSGCLALGQALKRRSSWT
ncbi:putative repeat protein (TIGR01451 family) [Leifsonia sp. EB41]|uniref:DUF11 domain-containing protein n=1 Tax=Leifsonia sp. EB41 TaxID=3156260 RepID=UPI003514D8CA